MNVIARGSPGTARHITPMYYGVVPMSFGRAGEQSQCVMISSEIASEASQ